MGSGLGSPDSTPTVSFKQKESLKPNLKSREGICLLNLNWELGLMARNSRNRE